MTNHDETAMKGNVKRQDGSKNVSYIPLVVSS